MYAKHYVRAAARPLDPRSLRWQRPNPTPPFPPPPSGSGCPPPGPSHPAGLEWEEGRVMFTVLLAPFVVASWSQMGVLSWGPDPARPKEVCG